MGGRGLFHYVTLEKVSISESVKEVYSTFGKEWEKELQFDGI